MITLIEERNGLTPIQWGLDWTLPAGRSPIEFCLNLDNTNMYIVEDKIGKVFKAKHAKHM